MDAQQFVITHGSYIFLFTVPLLLWTLLIASTISDKIKRNSTDTGIITNFLRKIVSHYIESNQFLNGKRRENPPENKMLTQIESAIRRKVIKLKSMLQDVEHKDQIKIKPKNNVKLDENDKTTVIELLSGNNRRANLRLSSRNTGQEKDTLNSKIEKYKDLRRRIRSLLHEEKTSISTSKLIIRTLDEMLALLIERKNVDSEDVVNYLLKNAPNSVKKLSHKRKVDGYYKLMCYLRPDKSNIHNNIYTNDPEYDSPRMKSSDKNIARDSKIKATNQCDSFKVCSDELRDFLRITYHHLNETAVSTFTNYAAMYLRDVKEETKSVKDVVSSKLEHLGNSAENKVNEIFLKELEHFTLDENGDKTENIEHMNNFIKATTYHIKSSIQRLVNDKLSAMKRELFSTMKDDLTVNLRMDMDNLNRLFETSQICSFFVLCNGTPHGSKRFNIRGSLRRIDDENIHVNVQRRLNDELHNFSAGVGDQFLNFGQQQSITEPRSYVIESMKHSYANVTRSTERSIATAEGTFSSEHVSMDPFF